MAIQFSCACKQLLEMDESFAGKKVRCPFCKEIVDVPEKSKDPEDEAAGLLDELDLPDTIGLAPDDSEQPTEEMPIPSAIIDKSAKSNPISSAAFGDLMSQDSWELTSPAAESKPSVPATETEPAAPAATAAPPMTISDDDVVENPASATPNVMTVSDGDVVDQPAAESPQPLTITASDIVEPPPTDSPGEEKKVFSIGADDVVDAPESAPESAPETVIEARSPDRPTEETPSSGTGPLPITAADVVSEAIPANELAEKPSFEISRNEEGGATVTVPGEAGGAPVAGSTSEMLSAKAPAHKPAGPPHNDIITAVEVPSTPILEDDETVVGTADADTWYGAGTVDPTKKKKKKKKKKKLGELHKMLIEESAGMQSVATGLQFFSFGILLLVLTFIIGLFCVMWVFVGVGMNMATGGGLTGLVVGVVGVMLLAMFVFFGLSGFLNFVGMIFCCRAPKRSNSGGFMFISICLLAGSALPFIASGVLLFGFDMLTSSSIPGRVITGACDLASYGMLIGAYNCYFLFIHNFSNFLEEGGIASEARDIFSTWLFTSIGGPILMTAMLGALMIDTYLFLGLAPIFFALCLAWTWKFCWQWVRWYNTIASLRKVLIVFYDM